MQVIDIYEMIEVIMGQSPFNLPENDEQKCDLLSEVVGKINPLDMATALREVAAMHKLSLDYDEVFADDGDHYDDSMDGDHASALASCGWGTDEDYGSYDSYGADW